MKRLHGLGLFGATSNLYRRAMVNVARVPLIFAFVVATAWSASAQSVKWTDSFIQNTNPTTDQCANWSNFLDQLNGRTFSSVTFYGSNSPEGKTLSDGAAATALAGFLSNRTAGSVVADNGDVWSVLVCGMGQCGGPSVVLSVTPGTPATCGCVDQFSVRPHYFSKSLPGNWGGLNTDACGAISQSMTVEFRSGAYITTPTTILCPEGEIQLKANSNVCTGPYTFEWSNGLTGEYLTVSEPGTYFVTAFGADGLCSAKSDPITITRSDIELIVSADKDQTCGGQIQLTASGTSGDSGSTPSKFCMYDALGGDCIFTNNICDDDSETFGNTKFSQDITVSDPESISVKIYYALSSEATFFIRLNGEPLGEPYQDNIVLSSCTPGAVGQYPRTFSYPFSAIQNLWKSEGPNTLEVEIQTADGGISLGGIVAEVSSRNAFYSWTPAETLTDASIFNPVATPTQNTTYSVTYRDGNHCELTKSIAITVACPPVATCQDAVTLYAGKDCLAEVTPADIDKGSSSNPEGLPLEYALSHQSLGLGTTDVTLTVTSNGETATCTTPVTVVNTVPVINDVVASPSSVDVNADVILTVDVTDHNLSHATVDWGDLAVETVENPESVFDVSHAYSASGSYSVTITVFDHCGESAFTYENIVVLSSDRGTVSGGGWFESPRGAYFGNRRAHGKATFSFDVTSENANAEPEGEIFFKFRDARIRFHSSDIEMFAIEDKSATMKAVGEVNRAPGYQILISVVEDFQLDRWDENDEDDDANGRHRGNWKKDKKKKKHHSKRKRDYIRVKIWDPSGTLIYDTQKGSPEDAVPTTPLEGGSIKVEETESEFGNTYDSPVASSYGNESTSVYPNPFEGSVDVQFNSASPENVLILVLDLGGKVIYNDVFPASENGSYLVDIFEDGEGVPGIYIMVIKQGRRVEFLRLVRN